MQGITFNAVALTVTKDLVIDFGAFGDGDPLKSDENTRAFIRAGIWLSEFINPGDIGVLEIPSYYNNLQAVYIVGKQLEPGTSFDASYTQLGITITRGWNNPPNPISYGPYYGLFGGMMRLDVVNNVIIKGTNPSVKPIIKFKDDLYFGSFLIPGETYTNGSAYTNTGPTMIPLPQFTWYFGNGDVAQQNLRAFIGNFIEIVNSNNVTIRDIIVNGNNTEFNWGGRYRSGGIQLPHRGINCLSSAGITISNVDVSEMGEDGITLDDVTNDVEIYSCELIRNTRTALGWLGGDGLIVNNCKMNETGQINNPSYITALADPGAGLDIEPDNQDVSKNGTFTSCEFINNVGCAIVNDPYVADQSDNVHFVECTVYSPNELGIFCNGTNFVFEKCSIYAAVSNSGIIFNPLQEGTKYIECSFEDKPYNGIHWNHSKQLVHIPLGAYYRTNFIECNFTVKDDKREFFWLHWSTPSLPIVDWTVIQNCDFNYHNKGVPGEEMSYMRWVVFKGENTVLNHLNGVNSHHIMATQNIKLEGSDDPCLPSKLAFEGQVEHYMLHPGGTDEFIIGKKANNIDDGYSQYVLKNKSYAGVNIGINIEIGPKSSMHIMKGASIHGEGKYEVNGGLIAHEGSYVDLETALFDTPNPTANTLLYFDKDCNKNATTTSPLWSNGIGYGTGFNIPINNISNWLKDYKNDVTPTPAWVQGGNTYFDNLVPPRHCPTLYTNVMNINNINLLYNKKVDCYGLNATANFACEAVGGTPNYTITCAAINNGNPLTMGTTYSNLPVGSYSIQVADATNCTVTFAVNLDTTLEYKIVKGCVNGAIPAEFTTNVCLSAIPTDIIAGPAGANINYASGIFSVSLSGTYTITATKAQNTTVTKTLYIGDCSNCTTAPTDAEWYAPNATSSSISPDGMLAPKPTVLQGAVPVDNEWFIYNNPNVYLTASALLDLEANMAIVINSSHLQGCTAYWDGIAAIGAGERVIVNNNSTVQDMQTGILIMNNAFLQARKSIFLNNQTSIFVYNSLNPNPESFIYDNDFEGDGNMFANGNGNRPMFGIKLFQVGDFTVGNEDDPALGNRFENMSNGIYIRQQQVGGVNSTIGIYNNLFTDIYHDGADYVKINSCYTTPWGAAIFSDASANPLIVSYVDVQNTNPMITFTNCDKAIVALGSGLTAKKLTANNCLLGIMCKSIYSRHYVIEDNTINNVHMGIQLSGLQRSASIKNNTVAASKAVLTNFNNISGPIGIKYEVVKLPSLVTYPHIIADNNITINRITGIGIFNGNTDHRLEEKANNIYFTTTNTVPAYNHGIPGLIGYWNENNMGSQYIGNSTNGITNVNVWPHRNSMGLYMNQSKQCLLSCNRLKFTRYGFYVWGNNETAEDKVTLNKCNANEFPWFFADINSPGDGTFGNVGGTNDNGNEFISTTNLIDWRGLAGINTGIYKVFRNGIGGFFGKISTDPNLLDFGESGPYLSGYEYLPGSPANSGYTDLCPDNNNDLPEYIGNPQIDSNEYISALAVATDSVTYNNFPIVGSWIDKYRLYLTLDTDSMLLNSSPELLYFYNTTSSQTIGDIKYAAEKIALLYDSTTNANNDSLRYADAVAANTLISSANDWEMNEKKVNDVLLFLYSNPVDSVSLQMKEDVQSLASSCPFVEGSAVYRMRPIWNFWQPNAVFDDRLLCMQGQNKNQDNTNINIDSFIESQVKKQMATVKQASNQSNTIGLEKINVESQGKVKLYPNPANTFIIIEYNQRLEGTLEIRDNIGQLILETQLGEGNGKVQIALNDVASGLYFYTIKFDDTLHIGKLNIIK